MEKKVNNEENIDNSSKSLNNISDIIIEKINTYENKDIFLITQTLESLISEMLSFLIIPKNLVKYKIKIIKFLQSISIKNEINSEIISRILNLHNNKLSIFQIIIHEYIIYKNNSNLIDDEISYRRELLVLFDILITQITFDRESYHYILSFLINYLNVKNGNIDSTQEITINSEILNRILILLQKYYHPFEISKFYGNFFFF